MQDDFNGMIQSQHLTADNDAMSFCHHNIRSAVQNLNEFSLYLDNLKHNFSVIGILENHNNNQTDASGCQLHTNCQIRQGVAHYVTSYGAKAS